MRISAARFARQFCGNTRENKWEFEMWRIAMPAVQTKRARCVSSLAFINGKQWACRETYVALAVPFHERRYKRIERVKRCPVVKNDIVPFVRLLDNCCACTPKYTLWRYRQWRVIFYHGKRTRGLIFQARKHV